MEVEPENLRGLRELARLLEEQQDFRSLAAVLTRQATIGDEPARAGALLHLGRVHEKELGEHREATRAYLQALELDNIASGAVEGLERMFAAGLLSDEDVPAVASRLAPYYELTENYGKWASALESLVRVAKDDGERRAHLEMLADLYAGPLGDSVAAYSAVRRIFEIDPANHAIRERLVQLAELVGKLPEIAESARRVLQTAQAPTLRQELFMLVADVEERQPERLGEAEVALREVLKIDPLHMGAYRTLCRICKDAERWGALRETIEAREQHLPDVKQRIELLWQIIEIDEGLLYDRPHASATLAKIIELDRTDLKAYRILQRHHAEAKRWRELDNLLQIESSLVAKGDVADVKARRADLALAHFDDAAGALQLVAEILDLAPGHAQAIPLLERLLEVKGERHRAAAMLDALHFQAGNWARLVEILDIEREVAQGPVAIALLMRKAELEEQKLTDAPRAFDTWRAVLDLDAHHARALSEAERLAGLLARHEDLIALYQAMADKRDPSDLAGIADLLSRAARESMAHLTDRKAAIVAWRRVLDLDASNPDTGAPAAEALESLYPEVNDMAGLVHVLRTRAGWPAEADVRGRLLLRVADLQENRLEQLDAAVETYRGLLDGEGEPVMRAFENLDRIYQKTKQPRERVELLKRWLEHLEVNARRTMRFLIATIAEKELADLDEAVAAVRPILDDLPEDREALTTLARLYQTQGLPAEHLEILERLQSLAPADGERIELLRQIAGLAQGTAVPSGRGPRQVARDSAPGAPGPGRHRGGGGPARGRRREPAFRRGRDARAHLRQGGRLRPSGRHPAGADRLGRGRAFARGLSLAVGRPGGEPAQGQEGRLQHLGRCHQGRHQRSRARSPARFLRAAGRRARRGHHPRHHRSLPEDRARHPRGNHAHAGPTDRRQARHQARRSAAGHRLLRSHRRAPAGRRRRAGGAREDLRAAGRRRASLRGAGSPGRAGR